MGVGPARRAGGGEPKDRGGSGGGSGRGPGGGGAAFHRAGLGGLVPDNLPSPNYV